MRLLSHGISQHGNDVEVRFTRFVMISVAMLCTDVIECLAERITITVSVHVWFGC